jgi:hypothetical protein
MHSLACFRRAGRFAVGISSICQFFIFYLILNYKNKKNKKKDTFSERKNLQLIGGERIHEMTKE